MVDDFRQRFGGAGGVRLFRAPGRVNLIGEHTDYSLGFVLPMALDLATWVAAAPSPDGKLRIASEDRGETCEWPVAALGELRPQRHWTDYPIGVARELLAAGFPLAGANLLIRSTVPNGAGLSSSAALEVSCALAFLNGRELAGLELAKLCQRAERNFAGMPCGIMDQYIAVFGREHAAVKIDCRSLASEIVTLPTGVAFVAVNSMVKHALAGSAYRQRTEECALAVEILRRRFPQIESLRDATLEMLGEVSPSLPPAVLARARHVVTEDARVEEFVTAGTRRMGELFVASHRSLQHDFEVSCAELDFLVDTALGIEGVYGARMTGGGFGGCTVNLMRSEAVRAFQEQIAAAYSARFGVTPLIFTCRPSQGAAEVTNQP
jgi:galactokinase